MAVNLVANYSRDEAEHLLASSFAQFLADRTVHGAEQSWPATREYLAGYLALGRLRPGRHRRVLGAAPPVRARESALADADRRNGPEAAEVQRSDRRRGDQGARRPPARAAGGRAGRGPRRHDRDAGADRGPAGAPGRRPRRAPPRSGSAGWPCRARSAPAAPASSPAWPRPWPSWTRPAPRPRRGRTAADDEELSGLRASCAPTRSTAAPTWAEHEGWMQRWDKLEARTGRSPRGCGAAPGRWCAPSTRSWRCCAGSATSTASPSRPRARPCAASTTRPT